MAAVEVGIFGWCRRCGNGLHLHDSAAYCQDCELVFRYANGVVVQKPYVQTWAVTTWSDGTIMPIEWVDADADPFTDPATIETPFEIIHCGNADLAAKVVQALNVHEADRAQDI